MTIEEDTRKEEPTMFARFKDFIDDKKYWLIIFFGYVLISYAGYAVDRLAREERRQMFEQCVETKLKEPPQGLDVTIYCDRITRQ